MEINRQMNFNTRFPIYRDPKQQDTQKNILQWRSRQWEPLEFARMCTWLTEDLQSVEDYHCLSLVLAKFKHLQTHLLTDAEA